MTTIALTLGSAAVGILAVLVLFAWALRTRWFARFQNGFGIALMIALGGTGLATALAVGLWGYEAAQRIVFSQLVDGMSNIGGVVESQLDQDIQQTAKRLSFLANSDVVRKALTDPEGARSQLELLQQVNHRLLQISLYDTTGRLVLSTSRTSKSEPPNTVAMESALHGQPFISQPYHSDAFDRSVIYLNAPIPNQAGRPIGVISLRYNLQAAVAQLVGNVKFGQSGYAVLVDGIGHIIAHPDATRIGRDVSGGNTYQAAQHSPHGWAVGVNPAGRQTLFIYRQVNTPSTVAGKPMVLMTDLDVAEAMAPVHKLAHEFLGGTALIVLFWIFCARQAARQLTRPLAALLALISKVRENDLTARAHIPGRDEFGRFADAFNSMVQGLAERDRIKQIFGRYVTTQVSEKILRGDVNLGGQSRNVTMLFSDIRNFTGMSESMTPAQVVEFLNEYFSEMVDAIFEQGGVLDKFIGDGMLATFGSVDDAPDPCRRAVQAAMRMKAKLAKINAARTVQGKPIIHIGIGIHTADVIVGNIGSRKRSEYTVIGDGVNTCSRVEALNKDFGTTLLITQDTYDHVREYYECRQMPETKIRGKSQTLQLFEVVVERAAVEARTAA